VHTWIDQPGTYADGTGALVFVGQSQHGLTEQMARNGAIEDGCEKVAGYLGTKIEGHIQRSLHVEGYTAETIQAHLLHSEDFEHWVDEDVLGAYPEEYCIEPPKDARGWKAYVRLMVSEESIERSVVAHEAKLLAMADEVSALAERVRETASQGMFSQAVGHAVAGIERLRAESVDSIRASNGSLISKSLLRASLQDLVSGVSISPSQHAYYVPVGSDCVVPLKCELVWNGQRSPAARVDLAGKVRSYDGGEPCVVLRGAASVRTDTGGEAELRVSAGRGCRPGTQVYLSVGPDLRHVPASPWRGGGADALASAIDASFETVRVRVGYSAAVRGEVHVDSNALGFAEMHQSLPHRLKRICSSVITSTGLELAMDGMPCEYDCHVVLTLRPEPGAQGQTRRWNSFLSCRWRDGFNGSCLASCQQAGPSFRSGQSAPHALAGAWLDAGGDEALETSVEELTSALQRL